MVGCMLENIREDTREQDTSVMPGEERQLETQIIYNQNKGIDTLS